MERGQYSKRVREGKREEEWMGGRKKEKNKKKDKEIEEIRKKEAEKVLLAAVH